MPVNSGPIPGENYTSDTKNYPWHRPPEHVDLDKALDIISVKITKWEVASGLLTLADIGVPLYKISSMIIMAGISQGKWTLDLGLLLCGPLTRIIELMCQGFEVQYTTGLEDKPVDFTTGTFFKAGENAKTLTENMQGFKEVKSQMDEIKSTASEQEPAENPEAPTEGAPQEKSLPQMGFMAMKGMNP